MFRCTASAPESSTAIPWCVVWLAGCVLTCYSARRYSTRNPLSAWATPPYFAGYSVYTAGSAAFLGYGWWPGRCMHVSQATVSALATTRQCAYSCRILPRFCGYEGHARARQKIDAPEAQHPLWVSERDWMWPSTCKGWWPPPVTLGETVRLRLVFVYPRDSQFSHSGNWLNTTSHGDSLEEGRPSCSSPTRSRCDGGHTCLAAILIYAFFIKTLDITHSY